MSHAFRRMAPEGPPQPSGALESSFTQIGPLTRAYPQDASIAEDRLVSLGAAPMPWPPQEEVLGRVTYFLSTVAVSDVEALPEGYVQDITNLARLNDVRYLNKFFEAVNGKLPAGGYFIGCLQTQRQIKQHIFHRYPRWIAWPIYVALFVAKRVLPKLGPTKKLYFAFTKGRGRMLSKAEVLGRLVCCGFDIIDHQEIGEEFYFVVQKARLPVYDPNPSYGPIFRMRRVGQGGQPIYCYKVRTMHPYAEYLQAYLYEQNHLDRNGKIKDDFRITTWGRFMRRTWLDELPMLLNWLRGDLKLVGVRPLSAHYLSLYPKELAEKRLKYKPGLVPPFYADLPMSFDEIIASEQRYLQLYEQRPFRTDVQYGLRAVHNIITNRARSQ